MSGISIIYSCKNLKQIKKNVMQYSERNTVLKFAYIFNVNKSFYFFYVLIDFNVQNFILVYKNLAALAPAFLTIK